MKPYAKEKHILPEYPRTLHLPWKPNTERNDVVAQPEEAKIIFEKFCSVEEKVDGANCGMALVNGEAIIRNREFILSKGYNLRKRTPAKLQFGSAYTWFYEKQNKKKFETLHEIAPNCSVFGEWVVAQHGIEYDCLPDWFIAYDLYDYELGHLIPPPTARKLLSEAGFYTAPVFKYGRVKDYEELEHFCNTPSRLTTKGNVEGVYIKVWDDEKVTHRFKMVRESFVRGALWDHKILKKNKLAKARE
jgi:hypothetical protein